MDIPDGRWREMVDRLAERFKVDHDAERARWREQEQANRKAFLAYMQEMYERERREQEATARQFYGKSLMDLTEPLPAAPATLRGREWVDGLCAHIEGQFWLDGFCAHLERQMSGGA